MSRDQRGVLCLHGFTGTPYEVSYLADALHRRGFTVETPTLPGHATTPEDLNRTTRRQWRSAVASAVLDLRERCESVAIVGQSMGGLLALDRSATDSDIVAVVALATPLWLDRVSQALIRGLARLPRSWVRRLGHRDKGGGSDVRDPDVRAENPAYPVLPLAGVCELSDLMVEVGANLERVTAPVLVVHGRDDHTAPVACADAIIGGVSSVDRSLFVLPRSYHLVACDVEKVEVAERVGEFLERAMAA